MILNTRPAIYQSAFDDVFAGFGEPIVVCPMLAVEDLKPSIPLATQFDVVIFTSQIAVLLFPVDAAWHQKRVFAVGEATAALARARGFAHVTCTGENAIDMQAVLAAPIFKNALFPSARHVAADLSAFLPGRITRVVTYQTIPTPYLRSSLVHRLKMGEATYVPLFSTRSAIAFNDALLNAQINAATADITIVGMSKAVLKVQKPLWRTALVAPHATAASMAATLQNAIDTHASHAA